MKNIEFCNNCGRAGHVYSQCKSPITSYGIIAIRETKYMNENNDKCNDKCKNEILMIRRKDSLGFVEFVRGKYPLLNRDYILNVLNEMTVGEREKIKTMTFDELWNDVWGGNIGIQYRNEEKTSREKYNSLKIGINNSKFSFTLDELLNEVTTEWSETEWGFPKGRRNYQEKDISCALREFEEETGYSKTKVSIIQNILPYDELFTGSNYKCYKHRYYVGLMSESDASSLASYQTNEVSKCEWIDFDECKRKIRPYNKERLQIIDAVSNILNNNQLYSDGEAPRIRNECGAGIEQ